MEFKLHDRVRIPELECNGRVVATFHGDCGFQYKVRYFHNGDEKLVYLYEDELELVKAAP